MNCFAFIFVGIQRQWPPDHLKPEELPPIAREIINIWEDVALRTGKLDQNETTNIRISRHGQDERSKALTMLMQYNKTGGTRAMLAEAIKEEGMHPLSDKVLQGSFISPDDMDIN